MQRRGPQRSVDTIVNAAFMSCVFLTLIVCYNFFVGNFQVCVHCRFFWQMILIVICIRSYKSNYSTVCSHAFTVFTGIAWRSHSNIDAL